MEIESILKRFAPMILFDTNERYYPSTVEYYLANSDITKCNITPDVTFDQIIKLILSDQSSLVLKNPNCKYGFCADSDLAKTPLYVQFKEDEHRHALILTYHLFFPGQGILEYMWWCCYYFWCVPPSWIEMMDMNTPNIQTVHMIIDKTSFKLRELRLNGKHQVLHETEYYNNRLVLYSALATHELSTRGNDGCFQQSDGKGLTLVPTFMELIDS